MTRPPLRRWIATLLATGTAATVALVGALVLGDDRAVAGVLVSWGLVGAVGLTSLPVLTAMSVSPAVAFLVAMLTYGLQVVLGAVLLRLASPGGPLAEHLDPRWLGGSLIVLVLAATGGVVVDQLRSSTASGGASAAPETPPAAAPRAGRGGPR